jgi:hypothetical protein
MRNSKQSNLQNKGCEKMNMKKTIVSAAIALTIVLGSTGAVFAQSVTPDSMDWGTGVPIDADIDEYMAEATAEALGMDLEDVSALYESGSTFATIALAQGILAEDINDLMRTVRSDAINLAVADGNLTADQAAWLLDVQFGGNARGGMADNASRGGYGSTANTTGMRQYDGTPLYQSAGTGSSMGMGMGRGGRR